MLIYLAHPLASDPAGNFEKAKWVAREIINRYPDVVPVFACIELLLFSRA